MPSARLASGCTVSVWAVFQLADGKVREVEERVARLEPAQVAWGTLMLQQCSRSESQQVSRHGHWRRCYAVAYTTER